jgi:serine protease
MRKRIVTGAVAAALCLIGGAGAAQAQVAASPAGHHGLAGVPQVNLHRAFEARLSHVKLHKIGGIVYPRGHAPRAGARRGHAACTEPNCNLTWNFGFVQRTPQVYLIFWGPNWQTDPGQEASANYLISFFKGLGQQPGDNWSAIASQYNDPQGFLAVTGGVYMGAWNDTSTPPSDVTQSGLGSEADTWGSFLSSHGFTIGNSSQIVIATQSGTCPQGYFAPQTCGSRQGDNYCAWHSFSSEPYINLPYILDAGTFCGENFVNPGSAGTDDGWSIVGGHEYAETITDLDPTSGWWDPNDGISGGEIADKCAWGGTQWGSNDPSGDLTLATGSFAMQSLWSNAANGCVMAASGEDTVTATSPGSQSTYAHVKVSLQLTASSSGGNKLEWGSTSLPAGLSISTSGLITGAPTTPGTYTVTVGAGDHTGATGTASFTWTVKKVTGKPVKEISTGLCLNDKGDITVDGNPVTVAKCAGSAGMKWLFPHGGAALKVLGVCLTDPSSGAAKLVIAACTGATSQQWTHNAKSQYVLKSNGLCLTDPGNSATSGRRVTVATCKAGPSQMWALP